MCKKDYPDPQAFFESVKRCLRPNGRLVLRDVNSDNKVLVCLMNACLLYTSRAFQAALNSKIYVDKTGLLEYTNSVLNSTNA